MPQSEIFELLNKNYHQRLKYIADNNITAYRLYDNDQLWLPVAIDIYANNAIIHCFALITDEEKLEIESSLKSLVNVHDFYYKDRTPRADHTGAVPKPTEPESTPNPESPQKEDKTIIIEEYGHKFQCNLSGYLDIGLFLDHRETRRWIGEQSKGKIVLNTFAYTGSFSIYAAANGAAKTYSVDLSKTYCEWIKKNLELNNLPHEQNWVYKMDTREFFKYAKKKNLKFDIIIIDPPSFSRNKGKSFSVQKDHPQLINDALEVLTPTGFILFSNNKQGFRLQNEKLSPCTIQNIQRRTIPADFTNYNAHYCFVIRPA